LPLTNNTGGQKAPQKSKSEDLRSKIQATEQRIELVKRLADKDKQEWAARCQQARRALQNRRQCFTKPSSQEEGSECPDRTSMMIEQLRETNARLSQKVLTMTTELNSLVRSNRRLEIANETAFAAHDEFASYTTELKQIQQKFKEESKASKQRLERVQAKIDFVDTCYSAESNSCRVYEDVISKILKRVSEQQPKYSANDDYCVPDIYKFWQEGSNEILELRSRGVASATTDIVARRTPSTSLGLHIYDDCNDDSDDDYNDGEEEADFSDDSGSESSWWESDDDDDDLNDIDGSSLRFC